MVPKFAELKNILKSSGDWTLLVDKKEEKLLIETKKSVRGLTMCRGQGPIDHCPIDVFRCMGYKKMKNDWDLNNDASKYFKKVGANAYIYYSKSKPKMGISPRDFLNNYLVNIEKDGTIIILVSSTNVDYDYPE